MHLSRSRVRYLSAIGAVLPSLAALSCKDATPPLVAVADSGVSPVATETANVTAVPSGSTTTPPVASAPTDSDSDAAVWTPTPRTPVAVGNPNPALPRCPSGQFCTTEPSKLDPKTAAPAPYAKCALTSQSADDKNLPAGLRRRSTSFSTDLTATERAKTPNACCYTWVIPCPGGRAFRDATGTPSVARIASRDDWSAAIGSLALADLSPSERASLAEHWTSEAAFEHASVASFAQLTLDLMKVGAPPDLLAATQRAALDEIEHARIAFALAAAYGGTTPVGPAALAAMPGSCRSLADLARLTFIDACVGESVASATLADKARNASDPVLRDLLASMAEDEERHAELAWRIVAWALSSNDLEVARALAAAQADVIDELVSLSSDPSRLQGNELRASVLREVVLPCSVAMLGASRAPMRDLSITA
jgi:hypothetical protein